MAATSTHGTLWSSWVVKGPSHRIVFSGDSGHFDGFKAIGAAHGPFDLTLIQIGACDVAWQDIQGRHGALRSRFPVPVSGWSQRRLPPSIPGGDDPALTATSETGMN